MEIPPVMALVNKNQQADVLKSALIDKSSRVFEGMPDIPSRVFEGMRDIPSRVFEGMPDVPSTRTTTNAHSAVATRHTAQYKPAASPLLSREGSPSQANSMRQTSRQEACLGQVDWRDSLHGCGCG